MLLTWLVCSQLAQLLQFMWSLHCHNGFRKGTAWCCWSCASGGNRFPWEAQECSMAGQSVGQRFISLRYHIWSVFEFVGIALNLCVKEEKLKLFGAGRWEDAVRQQIALRRGRALLRAPGSDTLQAAPVRACPGRWPPLSVWSGWVTHGTFSVSQPQESCCSEMRQKNAELIHVVRQYHLQRDSACGNLLSTSGPIGVRRTGALPSGVGRASSLWWHWGVEGGGIAGCAGCEWLCTWRPVAWIEAAE